MKLLNYYVGLQSLVGLCNYTSSMIDATVKFKSECDPISYGDHGGYVVTFPGVTGTFDVQDITDQVTSYSCQSEMRRLLNARDNGTAYSVTDISVYREPPNRWLAASVLGLSMSVVGIPAAAYIWVGSWVENIEVRVSVLPVQMGEPWSTTEVKR